MDIQYIGEHLLAGSIGKGFIWASTITLLVSIYLYTQATRKGSLKSRYEKTAGVFFLLHFFTLVGATATLYVLIFNHYFEYSYVWQYTGLDLAPKYLVSSLWAGQEGSFLTWVLLQGTLGLILFRTSKEWKPWVMTVFLSGQGFLMSMLLGLKVGDISIGTSPFNLLREMPQNMGIDLFKEPNYLSMIIDGNGLNPLLENAWMVIHPPALFLGYAITLIPFSYALASLWRGQYHSWLRPAIPWALASILLLGNGIILGGRWAYESLTFGGFWAWDPVENASLVPWLLLVASLHLMLIASKRFHSYGTTYLFTFLSWFFVVYATYLTRSGVLGETSVHAFGDSGMALQMLIFNGLFLIIPILLLVLKRKYFSKKDGDEVFSKEFWMLIGSVIIVLSAFQVILTTSIPVINKVIGTSIAPPVDNVNFYNTWQLPFALLVSLLIAISQYLTYGRNELKPFLRKMLINAGIALLVAVLVAIGDGITRISHLLLLYFVILSTIVSIDYIIKYIRKTTNLGSAFTHVGFAIFLLGVLLAFSNSHVISRNTSGMDLGQAEDNKENLLLMKGISQPMGRYLVTYSSSEEKGRETFYKLDFVKKEDFSEGKIAFSVFPSVNHNSRMGNVYNPDTKHFIDKDIYTFISFTQSIKGPVDSAGYSRSGVEEMHMKDTIIISRSFVILDTIIADMKDEDPNNASLTANFRVLSMNEGSIETSMKYLIVNGELKREDAMLDALNLKLSFEGVSPDSQAIMVGIYEKKEDFIVIKAVIFPYMNVLWFGIILLFSGLSYAIIRRVTIKREGNDKETPTE
jgi:cytochrome c-type biogenesis protein CcmF